MHKRIFITGAPGSGKNWLAERLSEKLGIPFYDTDDIAWKKKYTIKRNDMEKGKILDKISKKDEWIICGAAKSYLGNMPKRAQLIIILKEHIFCEGFRIFMRYISRKFKGGPDTIKSTIETIVLSYKKYHKSTGEHYQFYETLKKKYPKKTQILSKHGKQQYLRNINH